MYPLTIMTVDVLIQYTTCALVRAVGNPDILYWNAGFQKLLPEWLVALLWSQLINE
jgi:hypothetical protein